MPPLGTLGACTGAARRPRHTRRTQKRRAPPAGRRHRPREPRGPKIAPGTEHTQRYLVAGGHRPSIIFAVRQPWPVLTHSGHHPWPPVCCLFGIKCTPTKTKRQVFSWFFSVHLDHRKFEHPVPKRTRTTTCGGIGNRPHERSPYPPPPPRSFCRTLAVRFGDAEIQREAAGPRILSRSFQECRLGILGTALLGAPPTR